MAVSVLNYLRIDRVDQAEKAVKAMSAIDDDSTVTQLATAWVNVFLVLHQHPPPPPPLSCPEIRACCADHICSADD